IKLWNVATGRATTVLETDAGTVLSVVYSPNGKTLASCNLDKVNLWDTGTCKSTATLQGHTKAVLCLAFSPDGMVQRSGACGGTVRIWDVAIGREKAVLWADFYVFSVAFTPNGKSLASVSSGDAVKLWSVATGQSIATLKGHTAHVVSLAFSPN